MTVLLFFFQVAATTSKKTRDGWPGVATPAHRAGAIN
jgi:hypothetical protein